MMLGTTGGSQPQKQTGTLHTAVTKSQVDQAFAYMWNAPSDEEFLRRYYHDYQPALQAFNRQQAAQGQGAQQ